jgi:gliding motility-associated-like protein
VRKLFGIFLLLACFLFARADHITGGEIFYSLTSVSGNQYTYHITYKLFMVCHTIRQFPDPAIISIFNKGSGVRIMDKSIRLGRTEYLQLTDTNPCVTDPPEVCYRVGYYDFDVTLPASADGYLIATQVIFRIEGINNLIAGYSDVGATYTSEIPGTSSLENGLKNNSARFSGNDLVEVCANNAFTYSFEAKDADGDQLHYSFCNAYNSGSFNITGDQAPDPPPYRSVPYSIDYSGTNPLGNNVHIDPNTGIITGIAPSAGIYVITVCVEEIRNGVVIATQRKDLQINIAPCSTAAATIPPLYMLCDTSKTIYVSDQSTSSLIKSYNWTFINAGGSSIFTSTSPSVKYTFPDTGIYKIKLVINVNDPCTDSATSEARVYPGFFAKFGYKGICINKPTNFFDSTKSFYGTVNTWSWDFGDINTFTDISDTTAPAYTYPVAGAKNVRLIVGDNKGCIDTIFNTVVITDKPPIALSFRDTLICVSDSVQLNASGDGVFSWSPKFNINNTNSNTPTVSPTSTTTYYVDIDDDGCFNRDSVLINVVDHVSLQPMNDTTICQGDAIKLNIVSNGLHYSWTPASQLNDGAAQSPITTTNVNTMYKVNAVIGSCSADAAINVTTVPYPFANAGNDTVICFQTAAQLHGTIIGSSFSWSPSTALINANTLFPVSSPSATTAYILSVFDTKGCPKPGTDTVVVTVLRDINAFAGRDTSVVINQSLQLNATGGKLYSWSPSTGLSATDIPNPVAIFDEEDESIRYRVLAYNEAGCVDSAFITVKVFKTLPSVFVPTAFTPNGDGRNDILKPIAAGMQRLDFFGIYNRWGQLVFSTSINGKGWDGTLSGTPQGSGTYVWMVKAVDFTGTSYLEKGTVTLIR